ncbi:MAG: hypothetical protein AB8B69_11805 [Chitinophagales bacterium]
MNTILQKYKRIGFAFTGFVGLLICLTTACTKSDDTPIFVPPPIPETPAILLPKEGDQYGNCVLVSWSKVDMASAYTLQIGEDEVFSYNGSLVLEEKIDSSEQAYIMDFRSEKTGTYYCRLKAGNVSGESAWTSPVSYKVSVQNIENCIEYDKPPTPTLEFPVDSASIAENEVAFSWIGSSKATHYQLQIVSLTGSTQVFYNKGNIEETKRTVLSFPRGVYYSWQVRAFNHTAGSAWSPAQVFWIEP